MLWNLISNLYFQHKFFFLWKKWALPNGCVKWCLSSACVTKNKIDDFLSNLHNWNVETLAGRGFTGPCRKKISISEKEVGWDSSKSKISKLLSLVEKLTRLRLKANGCSWTKEEKEPKNLQSLIQWIDAEFETGGCPTEDIPKNIFEISFYLLRPLLVLNKMKKSSEK